MKNMPDKGSKQQSCDTLTKHLKDVYHQIVEGLTVEHSNIVRILRHASTFLEKG